VLEDRLVQVRTAGEEAFERVTHFKGHDFMTSQYDVIRTPDVIGHVTIGSSICDFLLVTNRDQTRMSLIVFEILSYESFK